MTEDASLPFRPESVIVAELGAVLAEIDDVDVLHALQRVDTRTTAAAEYERRIRELAASSDPGPGYAVGRWNDRANYECASCPYSTTDEDRIRAHVNAAHAPPPEPERQPEPPRTDRFGNELTTDEG